MTNYVSNISVGGSSKTIGGSTFKGAWTWYGTYVVSDGSFSANVAHTYTLSSIPEDGYEYEVIGWVAFGSSTTNGQYGEVKVYSPYDKKDDRYENAFDSDYVRNKSTMKGGGTFRVCVSPDNRQITVQAGSYAINNLYVFISWYRRVGTNDLDGGTSYLTNVSVPSTTLVPNVVLWGSPTVSNGVISNFSNSNFAEIVGGKQTNNAEYVIKFTVGTTDTTRQSIYSAENFLTIEIPSNSTTIDTFRWDMSTTVTLFTATANTTYWIKILVNGQTKTYSYSTNGTNFTQVASFTDTSMIATENSFHTRLGNCSANYLLARRFKGSIDLNGCYINVDGSRYWSGMDYRRPIIIGGNITDGQWVASAFNVFTGNPTTDQTLTQSLSSYLPNDGCDYEVLVRSYGYTGATRGSDIQMKVNSGSTATHNSSSNMFRVRTSTASFREAAGMAIIPIKNSDRNLSVLFADTYYSGTNLQSNVSLKGYRRVGTNSASSNSNLMSNITLPSGTTVTIGGEILDDSWTNTDTTLFNNVTWNPDDSFTYNLKSSNRIPQDNYMYELLLSGWMNTGNVSGNWSQMRILSGDFSNGELHITAQNTRASSINARRQCIVFPLSSSGELTIYTYGASGKSGSFTLNLHGYRRIGINR